MLNDPSADYPVIFRRLRAAWIGEWQTGDTRTGANCDRSKILPLCLRWGIRRNSEYNVRGRRGCGSVQSPGTAGTTLMMCEFQAGLMAVSLSCCFEESAHIFQAVN